MDVRAYIEKDAELIPLLKDPGHVPPGVLKALNKLGHLSPTFL